MSELLPNQKLTSSEYHFEAGTLRSGLIISACYQVIQLLRDFLTTAPQLNIIINSLLLVILIYLYLLARKRNNTFAIAAVMHLVMLPVFIFFWMRYNGVDGSVPYFFFLYFSFIIFTLQGSLRFLVLSLYALMITYLMAFPTLFPVQSFNVTTPDEILALSIDCFVSALLISVFFTRVKRRFEKYRNQAGLRNEELKKIQSTIIQQNKLVEEKKMELEKLNTNLELLILQRTMQVEERNKMLAEYAFINAHVLRGPLSRVLGLLNLMTLEQSSYELEKVKEVQQAAKEMDLIIRKINDVLH